MKKSKIAKLVTIIFIIILIVGCISIFFIPSLYDLFKDKGIKNFNDNKVIYKIAFYMCYIICLFIVYKLISVFKMVYSGSPFKKELENNLKVNAISFMMLFVIVSIKAVFIPSLLSIVVTLICFIASLSFYVLAEVIKSAIEYKNEIDYTV